MNNKKQPLQDRRVWGNTEEELALIESSIPKTKKSASISKYPGFAARIGVSSPVKGDLDLGSFPVKSIGPDIPEEKSTLQQCLLDYKLIKLAKSPKHPKFTIDELKITSSQEYQEMLQNRDVSSGKNIAHAEKERIDELKIASSQEDEKMLPNKDVSSDKNIAYTTSEKERQELKNLILKRGFSLTIPHPPKEIDVSPLSNNSKEFSSLTMSDQQKLRSWKNGRRKPATSQRR